MKKEPMHLLFVCRHHIMRSPTAEKVVGNTDQYISKSAGLSKHAEVRLDWELLNWADRIFVMEEGHRDVIRRVFPYSATKEIIVLDIEDNYSLMDPELVKLIRKKVLPLLPHAKLVKRRHLNNS
ncbi:MAG: hypothetical protein K9J30_09075 [Bacteroidales bacterium]|nr:hypothetical protein [Bacteroidales bacterium]